MFPNRILYSTFHFLLLSLGFETFRLRKKRAGTIEEVITPSDSSLAANSFWPGEYILRWSLSSYAP